MNYNKLRIFIATTSWFWFLSSLFAKKHILREPSYIHWIWWTEAILLPFVSIISTAQLACNAQQSSLDMVTLIMYLFALWLFTMTCFYILGRMIIERWIRTPTPLSTSSPVSQNQEIQLSYQYADL